MQVDDQILSLAQREKGACSSIIYSLETLAWPQLHGHAQDFTMVQTSPFFVTSLNRIWLHIYDDKCNFITVDESSIFQAVKNELNGAGDAVCKLAHANNYSNILSHIDSNHVQ